ncbi:MAG TPA: ATP-binding protein [Gaiellaceae bacterium]|jgi:signal transduction histidine kinase
MTRRFIGVRWWLGAAFAVVAATSTAIVVAQFSDRSENVFRSHAEDLVLADARTAAHRATPSNLARLAKQLNVRLRITSTPAAGEHVTGSSDGRTFVATVPYRGGTLVATSNRPDVAAALSTINGEVLRAGVIAGVVGVVVGLLLAQLIALRLRRLSIAAEALAHGDFETPLRYRFRDEFGALTYNFERMRRQLRRSFRHIEGERDRLRMLLERLHEGVVTVDQNLAVHFANNEARRLLGVRLAEGDQLPEPWDGFSLREFVERLFDPDASLEQEHVRQGEERAIGLVGIPAQPEGDTVLIVLDDLTEQERRELAAREFVANAAHELRTPLTTIIGAVEVLQAGAKDNEAERDRFLAHIEREAARLARLAHALLALARAHAGQEKPRLEPTPLEPLLREVADDLRPREGVAVEVECAPGLAANVNRDLLEQALRNLGENAAKYTPTGRVVLRAYSTGRNVRVEVEDTGIGMSSETQRHVFDRFYRGDRDPEGFGLGLAIVRQAVQSLEGRIELDSAPSEGTRIRIVLERARVREQVPA